MATNFNFIFFSTDDISLPTLEDLNKSARCLAVVTTPPRPRGRGKKTAANPVDVYAREHNLKVIYTTNLKDPAFKEEIINLAPDFIITFSFPFILPKDIIMIPKWPINIHPSILPKYRGPAPIRWALIKGDEKTGITTIIMDEKIDTGAIVDQVELAIAPDETYGGLRKRISNLAPEITKRTILNLMNDNANINRQNGQSACYAPKISKEMTTIDWYKSSNEIMNLVRGLSPTPGAHTKFRERIVKILSVSLSIQKIPPGEIRAVKKALMVGTGDNSIEINRLKVAGSREISGQEFINGFHPDGEKFG